MKLIINRSTDPYFNLAFEEYLLKEIRSTEDFLILYRNRPSIIVGRNQNPFEEINQTFLNSNSLPIVRRISGGGTVYHDLGNLNYSFITSDLKDSISNYKKFTKPIIDFLHELNVPATFHGKSDILVHGLKISGNAQSYYSNRMLHHGTMLFDSNLDQIYELLHTNNIKAESKSIRSNKSKVANIKSFLPNSMTINLFEDSLITFIKREFEYVSTEIPIDEHDMKRIIDLSTSKYQSWSWNFGETPEFIIHHNIEYQGVLYVIHLRIKHGLMHIKNIEPTNNKFLEMIIKSFENKEYSPILFKE